MINIKRHKMVTKITQFPYEFCCGCGCIFETDEFTTTNERCPNGRTWFHFTCPECGNKLDSEVNNVSLYVKTESVEVIPEEKE